MHAWRASTLPSMIRIPSVLNFLLFFQRSTASGFFSMAYTFICSPERAASTDTESHWRRPTSYTTASSVSSMRAMLTARALLLRHWNFSSDKRIVTDMRVRYAALPDSHFPPMQYITPALLLFENLPLFPWSFHLHKKISSDRKEQFSHSILQKCVQQSFSRIFFRQERTFSVRIYRLYKQRFISMKTYDLCIVPWNTEFAAK